MKKFLALMFVCAGLTAMAAAPHVNNKAAVTKQATHAQVMKAAKAIDNKSAQAKMTSEMVTPKSFFNKYGLTPEQNRLAKKAPRRVDNGTFGDGTHIDFHYLYTFGSDGNLTQADPFYSGGHGVYFMEDADTMYCAGLYWNPWTRNTYYLPIYMDYDNMTFEIETGFGLDNKTTNNTFKQYTAQNSPTGQAGWVKIDTVMKTYLVNEQYFYSEEGNFDNVTGKIYKDGSLEFNDSIGYAFFGSMVITMSYKKTQNSNDVTTYAPDTTSILEIHRGTQFLVPTGTHEYKYKGSNASATTYTDNVYAYQYDDTTAVVFNLYGMGMPGNYMFIYEPVEGSENNMYMPSQDIYDTEGANMANSTFELDENHGFIFDDQGYVDGFQGWGTLGDACSEYIHWDATILMDTTGSLFYPLFDNYLRLNNDIWYLGNAVAPTITETTGDAVYTYTATTTEEGAEPYLFLLELDGDGNVSNYTPVANPYEVTRTDVDQLITLGAIADGANIGKNASELVVKQFTVPALAPAALRGDVDNNGVVDINDATRLIDVILGKDVEFNEYAADCNTETGDGGIDINDITALIDRVLNGQW